MFCSRQALQNMKKTKWQINSSTGEKGGSEKIQPKMFPFFWLMLQKKDSLHKEVLSFSV